MPLIRLLLTSCCSKCIVIGMTRSYPRNENRYDYDLLQMMVADGMATYFPAADTYVVKTEDGTSFAVRPHQVISPTEKAELFASITPTAGLAPAVDRAEAENLTEAYLTVLHGPAENRDGEFDDEARDLVQRLLADDGTLRDSLADKIESVAQNRLACGQTSWMSGDEAEEVLKYFGI